MGLLDILAKMVSSSKAAGQHFDKTAQSAPPNVIGAALTSAFRSTETPPVGNMVGQLFGNSNWQQQVGLINQILAAVGPDAAASLAKGVLGRVLSPGAAQATPDQVAKLTPQEVQAVVDHAHETTPGLVKQLGAFYAQYPDLVKTLGGAALSIITTQMNGHLAKTR